MRDRNAGRAVRIGYPRAELRRRRCDFGNRRGNRLERRRRSRSDDSRSGIGCGAPQRARRQRHARGNRWSGCGGVRRGDSVSAINGIPPAKLDNLAALTRDKPGALTADFAFDGGTRRVGATAEVTASAWREVVGKPDQVAVNGGLQIVAVGYENSGRSHGFRSGDRILVVNAQRVSSPQEVSLAVADAKQMHVVVQRGERIVSLVWDRNDST